MKKLKYLTLIGILTLGMAAGCGKKASDESNADSNVKAEAQAQDEAESDAADETDKTEASTGESQSKEVLAKQSMEAYESFLKGEGKLRFDLKWTSNDDDWNLNGFGLAAPASNPIMPRAISTIISVRYQKRFLSSVIPLSISCMHTPD